MLFQSQFSRPFMFLLVAVFSLMAPSRGYSQEEGENREYQFKIISDMDMNIQGNSQKIASDTGLKYAFSRKELSNQAREETLLFRSMQVAVKSNGQVIMDTLMDSTKYEDASQGQKQVVNLKDAPPQLAQMLKDSFDTPLCKIKTDQTGKEINRENVSRPGAKNLFDSGTVDNARFFHVPFPEDRNAWEVSRTLPVGNGASIKGVVKYEKIGPIQDGVAKVKVSGKFKAQAIKNTNQPVVLNISKFTLEGNQSYDLAKKCWVSGDLAVKMAGDSEFNGQKVGGVKGNMRLKLDMLPAAMSE